MHLPYCRLGLVLGLAVCLGPLGCSSGAAAVGGLPLPKMNVPAPQESGTLSFDDTSTLTLAPGAAQALYVTAAPPATYEIAFALIGESLDGSLDDATIYTGVDGHGLVNLRAPTQATTFRVRASLLDQNGQTGVSVERAVAVSEQGFGSVSVAPSYLGHRHVTTWTASVVTGTTCAELVAQNLLPGEPAGAITATAPAGMEPVIDEAPVGPSLAVAVRAGHFAWGCADATTLTADATLVVPVTVIDKLIDLQDGTLSATFAYDPEPVGYAAVLGGAVTTLVDAFMPTSSGEGSIVLNGMAASLPTADAATFSVARQGLGWDGIADTHFAALPQSLRQTCAAWATEGTAMQDTSFTADLVGQPGGGVTVTVTTYGTLDATTAGVTASGATWTGQADDSIQLTSTLLWEPSRFAGEACIGPAQQAQAGAATVADALTLVADCPGLATSLGAFGACTVDCVAQLCETAIAARWTAALGTSAQSSALGQVVVGASGDATVGDLAQPVTLTGLWQGQVADAAGQVPIKGGSLMASATPPPTP